jgi:hypothetical protein
VHIDELKNYILVALVEATTSEDLSELLPIYSAKSILNADKILLLHFS